MAGDPDQYICAKFHTSGVGLEQYNQSWPTIYPNPVTDELFIRTNDLRIITIHLTDVMGNIILTSQMNNPQARIDLSSLPSGIYHVTATDDQGRTWTRSVVKG
ncbi:MAG: T9SS type A sorting domain-containing protein [Flavobacteriales bacterium]|nr:T9SS type A sorting domain-containing protein [Flavobacteriales bacterium]